jgi:hypothetical protein
MNVDRKLGAAVGWEAIKRFRSGEGGAQVPPAFDTHSVSVVAERRRSCAAFATAHSHKNEG